MLKIWTAVTVPVAIETQAFIAYLLRSMAALKFLTIDLLLFIISLCHEMNVTHTEYLNLKRYGYKRDCVICHNDNQAAL